MSDWSIEKMSSPISNISLLLFLVGGYSCSLIDVRSNRYSIFPGMDIIKMDKCRSDTVATHKHCRLYGLFIEKLSVNNAKHSPRTPDDIDPGFYVRLYNKTNNYFPLMNYISIFNNPSVRREDVLGISANPLPHGPHNNTNYILDNNITRSLMRAVRFVQWTINLQIAAVFEELMNGISNVKNKDGFYMILIKMFKLTNSDLLFYCKFTSLDHCSRMYEGINFKIATNNILYGNCDPRNPISSLKKGRSFIYFCDSNDLNATIDAVNNFLNKSIYNNTTYVNEMDVLNIIELLNEKSAKAKSIYRISTYRLMGELLGQELRPTKLDLKPMWDKTLRYLVLLKRIINEYDLDLSSVVFNAKEREYSTDISGGGVITKSDNFYGKLENIIKILCWHDISTCDLRDPNMNLQINVNFINYIPLRLESNLFEQNMHILLTAHDVNTTNIIFSKVIYNEATPLMEYTNENLSEESDEATDLPFEYVVSGHSWLYWVVVIGLTFAWVIVVFLMWIFLKCIFCPTKKVTYVQKNQEAPRKPPLNRDRQRPQKIIQYSNDRIGFKDIDIPLIKTNSTSIPSNKKDVEYNTTRAEVHWSNEVKRSSDHEQNNNKHNASNSMPLRPQHIQLNRENSIYESADYVPIQCSLNRGILKTPSPDQQRQKHPPMSDSFIRKQYNSPPANSNPKRSLSFSSSVLSLNTIDGNQSTLPSLKSRIQKKEDDIYGLQKLLDTLGPDVSKSQSHYQSPKPQHRPIYTSNNQITQSHTPPPIKREHLNARAQPATFSSHDKTETFDLRGIHSRNIKTQPSLPLPLRSEMSSSTTRTTSHNKRDSMFISNTQYSPRVPSSTSDLNYSNT